MQYDVNTPEEYIEALDPDWRLKKLQYLRKLIKNAAPEVEECINYKMLGYKLGNEFVFHLNSQKNYVSFYVGDSSKVDPDGGLLKGLNLGKGCIRFTKSIDITATRMDEFIKKAIILFKQGVDIDC